jgi:hypothetical protein
MTARQIYDQYINDETATAPIGLEVSTIVDLEVRIESGDPSLFNVAHEEVYKVTPLDIYPRFYASN